MKRTSSTAVITFSLIAGFAASAVQAQPAETPLVRAPGPDGLVGEIFDANTYAPRTVNGVTTRAFGIGTFAWNMGDRPMEWTSTNNQHSVIIQNIYRGTGNRFEQIGMSWTKHATVAANQPFNPSYGPCIIVSGASRLGVNCSDLYGSGLNAAQSLLGPRYNMNPTTGAFSFPFASLVPAVATGDQTARRAIVLDVDVQPASNPGAVYYGDTAMFSPDDSLWGNGRNNYCARRFAPFPTFTDSPQGIAFDGPSYRTSALEYWASATPGVVVSRADILEQRGSIVDKWDPYAPGDTTTPLLPQAQWTTVTRDLWTRYVAASAVTANQDGTWTYNYAILNMNSHRSGAAFALHLPAGAVVSNTSFHAPAYHSGERIRNAPWNVTNAGGKLSWQVDPATETATFPNVGQVTLAPNALMFGSVYTFSVTVNAAPMTGPAGLIFYRAPADAFGEQGSQIALTALTVPTFCVADTGSAGGLSGPDGTLDNNDFIAFINAFFAQDRFLADIGAAGGIAGKDNTLDNNDFIAFINAFFTGCL